MSPGRRRLAVALLVGLFLMLSLSPAAAESDAAPSSQTLGECQRDGDVWLHIRTDDGRVLRHECVGTPADGLEALANAEVSTRKADGGYLCALAGYPEACPATFAGQFWQYWHAEGPGGGWSFSQKGAGDHTPRSGSIEGWCYNAKGQDRCELPTLRADETPSARVDLEADRASTQLWALGGIAVLLVTAGWWIRRRSAET